MQSLNKLIKTTISGIEKAISLVPTNVNNSVTPIEYGVKANKNEKSTKDVVIKDK